jgi:hypothetical protein
MLLCEGCALLLLLLCEGCALLLPHRRSAAQAEAQAEAQVEHLN